MKPTSFAVAAMHAGVAIAPSTPSHVTTLDAEATKAAHLRDGTATRAFSNTHIKASDGKCLYVDMLSGDDRENLTPVQLAECGATDGQGWDLVVAGKHNSLPNATLVVSTLTNACLDVDLRRAAAADTRVTLFSCGGRANGSGHVVDSQIFAFSNTTLSLERRWKMRPANMAYGCLAVVAGALATAPCHEGPMFVEQVFTLQGDDTGAPSKVPTDMAHPTATKPPQDPGPAAAPIPHVEQGVAALRVFMTLIGVVWLFGWSIYWVCQSANPESSVCWIVAASEFVLVWMVLVAWRLDRSKRDVIHEPVNGHAG